MDYVYLSARKISTMNPVTVCVMMTIIKLMENARNVQFIHLLLKIIQNAFVIIPTNGIIKLIDAKG